MTARKEHPEENDKSARRSRGSGNKKLIGLANPLPEDEVGPRLLVKLKAEEIIGKLKLSEEAGDPNCWCFSEVCALVASSLGKGFLLPGEEPLVGSLHATRNGKVIKRIIEKASPRLVEEPGGGIFVKAEAFRGLLMLGLGTSKIPFSPQAKQTQTAWLAEGLASLLGVPIRCVNERTFERAKREVLQHYNDHLRKMEQRGEVLSSEPNPPKVSRSQMLKRYFGQMKIPSGPDWDKLPTATRLTLQKFRLGKSHG